jgi:NAD(P)-dependent dehydrogenase (short-subunit alcohol dehydrogenase family)
MDDRIVLITGANSGIGKATALALAKLGATVIMHGRNAEKLGEASREVRDGSGSKKVTTLVADLSSMGAVRQLATTVQANYPKLDVLVNNAGVTPNTRQLSKDGFEMQFAVNYLAPFLLSHLLLDTLGKAAPARLVNVASSAASMGKLDFDNLQGEKTYSITDAYTRSKLLLTMFTLELASRLEPNRITVNALNPGWVETQMTRGMQSATGLLGIVNRAAKFLPFLRMTAEQGAATSVYLASSPSVAGMTGTFFTAKQKRGKTNPLVDDKALRERLWRLTEGLVGLSSGVGPQATQTRLTTALS